MLSVAWAIWLDDFRMKSGAFRVTRANLEPSFPPNADDTDTNAYHGTPFR